MTCIRLFLAFGSAATACLGQNAQVSGSIRDPTSLSVSGADVRILNEQTGGRRATQSNASGFYSLPSLAPGNYRITIRAVGFETIVREGIKLEVGDNAQLDFDLKIGDSRTVVTVVGGPPLMNTEDASVGTVVDRDIIDQMPLNGRGIQTLVELTPGVVAVPVVDSSRGQFAVNGQRNDANYFTVDGVSADFAIVGFQSNGTALLSQGLSQSQAGSPMIPANNFLGTFSNLVSPDALQEFQIQTSTFAPEFGHSPGAQIGMVTRSGSNQYSGSLFEYLRNDKMDANDWFADALATPKPPLRFNDFGGTVGGPIRAPHFYNGRDRTFFFLSVESLVAVQAEPTSVDLVPTLAARQNAPSAVAELLNAYPRPNRPYGADEGSAASGIAEYVGSYSSRQDQQSYGLRIDQAIGDRFNLFIRYNYAPAVRLVPALIGSSSNISDFAIKTQTLTAGLTHVLTPHLVNEVRWNGSAQNDSQTSTVNSQAGAQTPPASLLFPAGDSFNNSSGGISISPFQYLSAGFTQGDRARQLQAIDHLSWSFGGHQFKFGVDYRWFSPEVTLERIDSEIYFSGLFGASGAYSGVIAESVLLYDNIPRTAFVAKDFSTYAQDTWKLARRFTLTYGLRWEVDPSPYVSAGQAVIGVGTSNFNNASTAILVPSGRAFYPTSWSKFAPRLGIAWQLADAPKRKTVFRLGAGRFFDLGQGEMEGNGYHATSFAFYQNQPLGSITGGLLLTQGNGSVLESSALLVGPGYRLPNTWEWNATIEQSIGQQTLSAGYVAALGRHLVSWTETFGGFTIPYTTLESNANSTYNALQLQFNRRLSSSLHMLVSYTWAHSIDNLSNDAPYSLSDPPPATYFDPRERGSSDFDIRHSLNGSIIAALPSPHAGVASVLLRNWTANSIFFARSALPTDLYIGYAYVRPDLVPGQPLYLYGSEYPGGKSFNGAAFVNPPGLEGELGRNVLRGLGAWQIDFALHREFPLTERIRLQFRAEAFNILNHPNFANPSDPDNPGVLTVPGGPPWGAATQTLANGLGPTGVAGQLSPLFQIGGPRTIQIALRLHF